MYLTWPFQYSPPMARKDQAYTWINKPKSDENLNLAALPYCNRLVLGMVRKETMFRIPRFCAANIFMLCGDNHTGMKIDIQIGQI